MQYCIGSFSALRHTYPMPRHARLDVPGALYHVIVRGIERRAIVRDDFHRAAFVERLGDILGAAGTPCYAWVLLANHMHLLLPTGDVPLTTVVRRLSTGYAAAFNRRHRCRGYLLQNRCKSILYLNEPYLPELVRHLYLNPVRAALGSRVAPRAPGDIAAGPPRRTSALDSPVPWGGYSTAVRGRERPVSHAARGCAAAPGPGATNRGTAHRGAPSRNVFLSPHPIGPRRGGPVMLCFFIALVTLFAPVFAQATTPEAFLGDLPPLPPDGCHATRAEKAAYLQRVRTLMKMMDDEILRRYKETEAKKKALLPGIEQKRLADAGLSPADAERMKHGTPAERRAIADKMMQQQMNLSSADLESLKDMSPEARRAWALAYARELGAVNEADPQHKTKSDAKTKQVRDTMDTVRDLYGLEQTVNTRRQKYEDVLKKVEDNPEAKAILQQQLPPLRSRYSSLIGVYTSKTATEMARLKPEIQALEDTYCSLLSPAQLRVLGEYLSAVKDAMNDMARLEKIRGEMIKTQSGLPADIAEPGGQAIRAIRQYLGHLRDIFKYDIRSEVP
jgi:REP element-mobilizing transposase RayT